MSNIHDVVLKVKALAEATNNIKNSIAKFSNESGISIPLLTKHFYRDYPADDHSRKCLLTEVQEKALVYAIEAFSICKLPLSGPQIAAVVKKAFDVDVNKQWVSKFKKRHKGELSQTKIKHLSDKRTGKTLEEDVQYFIKKFQKYVDNGINKLGMNLLNFDETRIGPNHSNRTVVQRFNFNKAELKTAFQSSRNHVVSSMMPFVGANGNVLAVFYIIPGTFNNRPECIQDVDIINDEWKRNSLREFFVFNETGFMTSDIFRLIMKKVAEIWDEQHPGVKLFLLGDGCSAHTCNPDLVIDMHMKGKNILFLPPNTTHFTQPLDSFPFGSFKLKVYALLEEKQMISFLNGKKPAKSTVPEGQEAAKETLSVEKITAAFKETGIWPWNPEILKKNVKRDISDLDISEVQKMAVQACVDVINESKDKLEQKQKRKISVKTNVTMNYIMDVDDVKKLKEKKEEEVKLQEEAKELRAVKKRSREEAKENKKKKKKVREQLVHQNTCQGTCGKYSLKNTTWVICDYCITFTMCPKCFKTQKRVMDEHEQECAKCMKK